MTAPNLTPAEALECLRDLHGDGKSLAAWDAKWKRLRVYGMTPCIRAISALETLLSEHEAVKAKLAAYEAKVPSAFDMVNDAYPFAIAIRDERVGRTLSTPASGVPSLRSAMKDAFRVITGEPLVVEAKEPAAAVPSDEESDGRSLRLDECSDERIKKQLRWARENGRASAICTLVEMVLVRIGVKL